MSDEFYRNKALGREDRSAYRSKIEDAGERIWPQLFETARPPAFSFERFKREIASRFGAEVVLKRANGHFGLLMGHRLIDSEEEVTQYGISAKLRFVSLDSMVSLGYSSWFWYGRSEIGGWAEGSRIVDVRRGTMVPPVLAWEGLTDPVKRAEMEEMIERHRKLDASISSRDPFAFLPGLKLRLISRELNAVLEKLRSNGLQEPGLRSAFITEARRMVLQSSIFAHEGRHAIDALHSGGGSLSPADREFRAKLSEVAFSPRPFLALCGGILDPNIGDDTPHGRANLRLMKGLVGWMTDHADDIEGLDRTKPFLPQLDRLTEEQLVRAVRSMDPLAQGRVKG